MQKFDQIKAMVKMIRWVRKTTNRGKENLRRNLSKKRKGRAANKVAKKSRRRNRNG